MSNAALSSAWKLNLKTNHKIVIISLADRANRHHICWPSHFTIADDCALSRAATFKAIAKLIDLKLIKRKLIKKDLWGYQLQIDSPEWKELSVVRVKNTPNKNIKKSPIETSKSPIETSIYIYNKFSEPSEKPNPEAEGDFQSPFGAASLSDPDSEEGSKSGNFSKPENFIKSENFQIPKINKSESFLKPENFKSENSKMNADDVLKMHAAVTEEEAIAKVKLKNGGSAGPIGLSIFWKDLMSIKYPDKFQVLTHAHTGMFKYCDKSVKGQPFQLWQVIHKVVLDWVGFGDYLYFVLDKKSYPDQPNIPFFTKYLPEAVNYYLKESAPKPVVIKPPEPELQLVAKVNNLTKPVEKSKYIPDEDLQECDFDMAECLKAAALKKLQNNQ
jgi:hypothetical protein